MFFSLAYPLVSSSRSDQEVTLKTADAALLKSPAEKWIDAMPGPVRAVQRCAALCCAVRLCAIEAGCVVPRSLPLLLYSAGFRIALRALKEASSATCALIHCFSRENRLSF